MSSVITDTVNWETITGNITADSAYNFITIGNFYSDSLTSYNNITNYTDKVSYYYIDMICLSMDSLTCNPFNSINNNQLENNINVIPNPANDYINIQLTSELNISPLCNILDIYGKVILQTKNISRINVSGLADGVYLLQIIISNKSIYKKIIINH